MEHEGEAHERPTIAIPVARRAPSAGALSSLLCASTPTGESPSPVAVAVEQEPPRRKTGLSSLMNSPMDEDMDDSNSSSVSSGDKADGSVSSANGVPGTGEDDPMTPPASVQSPTDVVEPIAWADPELEALQRVVLKALDAATQRDVAPPTKRQKKSKHNRKAKLQAPSGTFESCVASDNKQATNAFSYRWRYARDASMCSSAQPQDMHSVRVVAES